MNTLLECQELTKKYNYKTVLNHLDLTLESGKIIGLLGPNGSGKTTLIKLITGLLTPTEGNILINGQKPGTETKKKIAYLPDRSYLNDWMSVTELIQFFADFYEDFRPARAFDMVETLKIDPKDRLKTLSKGTKEKIQLILVMCRTADLYILDEPIAGVDPAARDFIIHTIINNYNPSSSVLISTHLIADIESILDDVIFIKDGMVTLHKCVDDIRMDEGKSVDALFREVFAC